MNQIVSSGKFRRKFAANGDRERATTFTELNKNEQTDGGSQRIERENVRLLPAEKPITRKSHSSSLVDLKAVGGPKSLRLIASAKRNGKAKKHFNQVQLVRIFSERWMIGVNFFLQTEDASASCPDIWVSFKDDKRFAQEEEDLICVSTAVEVESLHSRPSPKSKINFYRQNNTPINWQSCWVPLPIKCSWKVSVFLKKFEPSKMRLFSNGDLTSQFTDNVFYELDEKYCRKTLLKLLKKRFDGRRQPHFHKEKLTYVYHGN